MSNVEIRLAKKEDAPFIAFLGELHLPKLLVIFRDKQDLLDYYNLTFPVEKLKMELRNQTFSG